MNHKKPWGQPLVGLCDLKSILLIAVLLGMIFSFLPGTAYGQQVEGTDLMIGPKPPTERPEWLKPWKIPQVPEDYQSPGELHKVIVEKGDTVQPGILKRIHPWNVYQYHRRKLYLISTSQLNMLPAGQREMLNIRDDLNLIRLRDRFFDTTVPQPAVSEALRLVPKQQKQLHLIQFVGPVRDDWISDLRRIEGITIVDYIPENAYLVWVDKTTRESLADWADFQYFVQWHGSFHPAYKLHPGFNLEYDGEVTATIQLVTHKEVNNSIALIKSKASEVLRDTYRIGPYTNISVKLPATELVNVAQMDNVVNVEPWTEPSTFGERQDQIVAGNLNAVGTGPSAPGYLAWLNGLGFNSNFDFAIDVTDDGFDQGETGAANVHEDFLDTGGSSRVIYVRRVSGTTISTTNDEGCEGHGTINAAIAGGFNNTPITNTDFDYYGDGNNYRYGLGVAPYVLLGSSKVLDPWSNPDYTTLIDAAYADGARISSNSWGEVGWPTGAYIVASQEYDGLVRDGRPSTASSGGKSGNQEMVIVFAAGNAGPGAQTIGDYGAAAKNTITVGACENFNATGDADGCGIGNAGANNVRDIINFSSRGSCDFNRVKPDIMAPGTHVFGAASQDACFDGDGVCGPAGNIPGNNVDEGNPYYPPDPDVTDTRDQDLYTWSTGTSHACPAVAGGAALLRQWFLDHGHPAPSPAMTKAYLMNTTIYMTGPGDDLPSNNQGMGRMNLGMTFDNTPRLLFDQVKTCHRNGTADASEIFTVEAQVADITQPFRATLVWTDAPGNPVTGVISRNDLDLELEIMGNGNFYRGNDFTLDTSNPGAPADAPDDLNNVESVFLPANTLTPAMVRDFRIRVRPTNINSDGVTNNGDLDDQDFALVIYNAEFPPRNPVDIILVLDRSGSMNSIAAGGTQKKIDLLKDAVEMFIRTWEPYSIPEDRMGIVYFNNSVSKFPNASVILHPFQDNANALIENVRAITATNCTALGGGILTALRGFDTTPGHQKHIIVFTNGMQNCSPMVTKLGGNHQILDDPSPPCCNSGIPDESGVNLADYDVKAIHTIGTGVSSASWVNLIMDIATETGGRTRFTSTPDEDLEDFFLETLVDALRVDPVEKVKTVSGIIARTESQKEELFSINSSVRKATFILSWRGGSPGDSLTFDLIAPNNITIPVQMQTIKTGSFYRIATIKFPLDIRGNQIEHTGIWKLTIKPALSTDNVSYRAHLIVDDADVRYHFDVSAADYGVGDVIPLSFWAQHDNRTLSNLTGQVIAIITRPPIGFGTFMVKHPITQQQLDADIDLSGDMFSILAAKKAHILLQNSKLRKELEPTIDTITLYDDGNSEHGDIKANDGVYSALYKNTTRPGFYNIDLSLKAQDPQLGTITRSESKTITIEMKQFDLGKSSIDIKSVRPIEGKVAYIVNVLLIDSYGNYLGPGHSIDVVVAPPGKKWGPIGRHVRLDDNLDGTYSGRVELTEEEVDAGAKLEIDIDGLRFTEVEPPPPYRKFSLSIHGGIAVPIDNFADDFEQGYNVLVDLDYHFTPQLSFVGFFGYNDFKSKTAGIDDNYWMNISANLKYREPLRPRLFFYFNGGPGYYIPETGDSRFGLNLGAGFNYDYTNTINFELGADYHTIFDEGIQFVHSHAGLIIRF